MTKGAKGSKATKATKVGCCLVVMALIGVSAAAAQPALNAVESDHRIEALKQIDRAGVVGSAEEVAALLRDADDEVQLAAIDTLLNVLLSQRIAERRKIGFVIEMRKSTGPQGAFEKGMTPAHPVPPGVFELLAGAIGDLNPQVRFNAAYAAAILAGPDPDIIPTKAQLALAGGLATMLISDEPQLRFAAARTAGRVFRAPIALDALEVEPHPQALSDALIALMNQPTIEEQSAAMEASGLARDVRSLQALTERFIYYKKKGPRSLAITALEAIARIAHPSSADLVRSLASDRWARDARAAAAVALARERILNGSDRAQ